jgi:hypothetical protein
MLSDNYQFSAYSELNREQVKETIKQDLIKILGDMPESTNDHKKVSMEYRIDRIMECIDILRSPSASLEEKARARKKKYKLLHPDKTNAEQNERRRKQYQENKYGYANKVNEKVKEFRKMNEKYRLDAIRRSNLDSMVKRNYIYSKLGGHCVLCGNNDRSALEAHHVNPEEKEYFIHDLMAFKYREILDEELKKCVLLCTNCHIRITSLQRFLRSCENTNMSIDNLFGILRNFKEGKTILDISISRGIEYNLVERIIHRGQFEHLTQIGTPYIQPPFFNFDTSYCLQQYVDIREFNRIYANRFGYTPLPPVQYAGGITPYNLDEMEKHETDIGDFYSIPGTMVTPYDFDDCDK